MTTRTTIKAHVYALPVVRPLPRPVPPASGSGVW
jgi:hypothetical protein